MVEVVAAVPPALPERRVEQLGAGLGGDRERPPLLQLARPPPRPRRRARCRCPRGPRRPRARRSARVATSSYMRTTDGRWPAWSARRIAWMPASTDGNATAAKRRASGSGASWSVARVMTPSVPSEPTKSCVSSGPTAWRGTATVSISPSAGRRDAEGQQQVLDLPVAGREDARAARRDVAADRRPLDRRGVVREHQPAGVELGLEPRPFTPACAVTVSETLVDLEDRVERAQVDDDPALDRRGAALGARAAAPRRRPARRCASASAQHLGDLLLGPRAGRRRRAARSALRRPPRGVRASTCRRRRPVEPFGRRRHRLAERSRSAPPRRRTGPREASSSPAPLVSKSAHNLTGTLA